MATNRGSSRKLVRTSGPVDAAKRKTSGRSPERVQVALGEFMTLHRATGRAYIRVGQGSARRRVYVGDYWDETGEAVNLGTLGKAKRAIRESQVLGGAVSTAGAGKLTVQQLVAAFVADRSGWASTGEQWAVASATGPLLEAYGETLADEFTALNLKAVRLTLVERGLSRKTVNAYISRIRSAFAWGDESGLVNPATTGSLLRVKGLREGRTAARETEPIRPVSEDDMRAVLPHVAPQVAALIELCWLSGMRPGEATQMRPGDIDRSDPAVWTYTPRQHKLKWRGKDRRVQLGAKAQAILRPWLLRAADAPCFSPAEAEEHRLRKREAARITPKGHGNRRGSNRVTASCRKAGEQYTTDSFRRAIERGCDAAGIERWAPNRLRHAAATRFERLYGMEGARVVLDHAPNSGQTATYVASDRELAKRIAAEHG